MDDRTRRLREKIRDAIAGAATEGPRNIAISLNVDGEGHATAVSSDGKTTIVSRDGETQVIRTDEEDQG